MIRPSINFQNVLKFRSEMDVVTKNLKNVFHAQAESVGYESYTYKTKNGTFTDRVASAVLFRTHNAGAKYISKNGEVFKAKPRPVNNISISQYNTAKTIIVGICNALLVGNLIFVRSALTALAGFCVACVKNNIDRQVIVDKNGKESPMPPLSEAYKKRKEKQFKAGNKPILVRTGQMYDSLRPSVKGMI